MMVSLYLTHYRKSNGASVSKGSKKVKILQANNFRHKKTPLILLDNSGSNEQKLFNKNNDVELT